VRGAAAHARVTTGSVLLIFAGCLLGFAVWFLFLSKLYYDRAQNDSYANFRVALAQQVAPVGPTQPLNPQLPLTPGTPVALLTIPELGLNAVVFEGTSGQVLESGPGHLRYTSLPGQTGTSVIFGRRTAYGGPFSELSTLQIGDTFTATTGQGVATYQVADVRRAGDPVPPPLLAGRGRLILITTDGSPLIPTGVLYVDANLTSPAHPAPEPVISEAELSPGELALGTDTFAWLPLVLWGQGMLVAVAGLSWIRYRLGRWQAWLVAVPVVGFLGLIIADEAARLLPNLM
jgi:sortase A